MRLQDQGTRVQQALYYEYGRLGEWPVNYPRLTRRQTDHLQMERIAVPPYGARSCLTLFLVSTLLVWSIQIQECPVLGVRKISEM